MSDNNLIRESIIKWIEDFVETPHPLWNNMPPCPYARSARIKNNDLSIKIQGTEEDYYDYIEHNITLFKESEFDVMLVVANTKVDATEFTNQIDKLNNIILADRLILLTDHPDIVESNHGVSVQQGTYVITFIQRIDNLLKACEDLHKTAYYDNWEPAMYKAVVTDRFAKCNIDIPTWAKQK